MKKLLLVLLATSFLVSFSAFAKVIKYSCDETNAFNSNKARHLEIKVTLDGQWEKVRKETSVSMMGSEDYLIQETNNISGSIDGATLIKGTYRSTIMGDNRVKLLGASFETPEIAFDWKNNIEWAKVGDRYSFDFQDRSSDNKSVMVSLFKSPIRKANPLKPNAVAKPHYGGCINGDQDEVGYSDSSAALVMPSMFKCQINEQ